MSDAIELKGFRALGVHGALASEQQSAQPFEFDLVIETDLAVAGGSDDLGDTVDYGQLAETVAALVADEHHQLLESLAASIAAAVLGADRRVEAVTVALRKLRPPLPFDVASVGVRIRRARGELALRDGARRAPDA